MQFVEIRNTEESLIWSSSMCVEVEGLYFFYDMILDNHTFISLNENERVWADHFIFIGIDEFSKRTNIPINVINYIDELMNNIDLNQKLVTDSWQITDKIKMEDKIKYPILKDPNYIMIVEMLKKYNYGKKSKEIK